MSATRKPRVLFFGTPDFAVPCLRAVAEQAEVPLVICQPDRRSGRGMKLTPPPVKVAALELGLSVQQPTKVRTAAFAEQLRQCDADLAVVVAYGRILPTQVLGAPKLGCVNVHASLLPKYRGAAPIVWAIVRGERESGVSLMQMDEGMDTGPELARLSANIEPNETAGQLSERLSALGAELIRTQLPNVLAARLSAVAQPHAAATMAPMLSKADGVVDFTRPAQQVHDHIRGMAPWPGAQAYLEGKRVKLLRAHLLSTDGQLAEPGQILCADKSGIEVACGEGVLVLDELQLEGRKRATAEQFCAGHRPADGAKFQGAAQ